ncbi:ROK family protein [Rhodobacteraceae bacterium 2CG4]|uniref:ROK family protein n=1 Tax=Halovulum marinum TaxID=2662447 RepID=A0A6L5YWY7_9RHOB|nr:ROK family transcriptional regulator [Halovulum marinum]MSU88841.1 ROK family protein [Halovulum marinum]
MVSVLSLQGANAERARSHNRRLVMGHVHAGGQMGRAQIARASGLSTQAVSNIIAELQADGLIRQTGRLGNGRGHPPVQYAIDPEGAYALGIEVRPTALLIALLNLEGTAVFTRRAALERADPGTVLGTIARLRAEIAARHARSGDRTLGAGVVMPGPFGVTGLSGAESDLPGWQQLDPRAVFAEALDLPIEFDNDANAAAMAERVTGAAQGLQTYAYLYFGTGLGLGLVSAGQRVAGAFGNAGEIGHLSIATPEGPERLENLASRLSIEHHLADAGLQAGSVEALEALQGHPAVTHWLDRAAPALAQAVHVVENLFDPETVFLGGAMPAPVLDALIARIDLPAASVSNRPDRTRPRLARGSCGRLTATLGAAALILDRAFTPRVGTF